MKNFSSRSGDNVVWKIFTFLCLVSLYCELLDMNGKNYSGQNCLKRYFMYKDYLLCNQCFYLKKRQSMPILFINKFNVNREKGVFSTPLRSKSFLLLTEVSWEEITSLPSGGSKHGKIYITRENTFPLCYLCIQEGSYCYLNIAGPNNIYICSTNII